ncbi:MAG TPA: hypothetical protein VEQ87_06675 [Burkholderiales bacterium]|nr:hypothetical protein [Burkholderiales bacterium]
MRLLLALTIVLATGSCTRTPPGPNYNDADEAAMGRVEESAARTGARIYWVNPPRKPAAPGS